MSTREKLHILFGAIPATGWGVYIVQAGWDPHWIFVCWYGAISLWATALAPDWARSRAGIRWALVPGLFLGICLAVIPVGFNVMAWLMHLTALSLSEHLRMFVVFGALAAPVVVAAHALVSMIRPRK